MSITDRIPRQRITRLVSLASRMGVNENEVERFARSLSARHGFMLSDDQIVRGIGYATGEMPMPEYRPG